MFIKFTVMSWEENIFNYYENNVTKKILNIYKLDKNCIVFI